MGILSNSSREVKDEFEFLSSHVFNKKIVLKDIKDSKIRFFKSFCVLSERLNQKILNLSLHIPFLQLSFMFVYCLNANIFKNQYIFSKGALL